MIVLNLCSCVWYVYVCIWTFMCVHTWHSVHTEIIGPYWALNSTLFEIGLLISSLWGALPQSPIGSTGIIYVPPRLALCGFCGLKLRSSCLYDKYFTHWAISSARFHYTGSFHVPPNLLNNKNASPLYIQALDRSRNKSKFVQNFSFPTERTWHYITASHSRDTGGNTGVFRTGVSLSGRGFTSPRPWGTASAKQHLERRGTHTSNYCRVNG